MKKKSAAAVIRETKIAMMNANYDHDKLIVAIARGIKQLEALGKKTAIMPKYWRSPLTGKKEAFINVYVNEKLTFKTYRCEGVSFACPSADFMSYVREIRNFNKIPSVDSFDKMTEAGQYYEIDGEFYMLCSRCQSPCQVNMEKVLADCSLDFDFMGSVFCSEKCAQSAE